MSWTQLLAVGRSFKGTKEEPHRYKVAQPNLLPKFEPDERPSTPVQAAVSTSDEMKTASLFDSPAAPAISHGFAPIPEARPRMEEPSPVAPLRREPSERPRRRRLGLFGWRRKTGAPFGQAIQGELSLETVRVVRNDLSDADLELVRVKKKASAAEASPFAAAPVAAAECVGETTTTRRRGFWSWLPWRRSRVTKT